MNAMGVVEEESPPPYEMAVRMCTPLYRRLRGHPTRQSASVKPVGEGTQSTTATTVEEARTLLPQAGTHHL